MCFVSSPACFSWRFALLDPAVKPFHITIATQTTVAVSLRNQSGDPPTRLSPILHYGTLSGGAGTSTVPPPY